MPTTRITLSSGDNFKIDEDLDAAMDMLITSDTFVTFEDRSGRKRSVRVDAVISVREVSPPDQADSSV